MAGYFQFREYAQRPISPDAAGLSLLYVAKRE
jgi:hypothetical protein